MTQSPLPAQLLEALRRIDTCSLANAIEPFGVRLRNEGFTDGSIRAAHPQLPPVIGYAATLKVRSASPPTGARTYCDRTDWWDHVLAMPAPRFLVVQDVGTRIGFGALLGEVHINIIRALGCVAAATNGSVRDLAASAALGFPLFSGSVAVSHSYVHIVEFGTPVEVSSLLVHPGALLHADRHGVLAIPHEIAARLPDEAARLAERERAIVEYCRSPEASVAKLRELVSRS